MNVALEVNVPRHCCRDGNNDIIINGDIIGTPSLIWSPEKGRICGGFLLGAEVDQ